MMFNVLTGSVANKSDEFVLDWMRRALDFDWIDDFAENMLKKVDITRSQVRLAVDFFTCFEDTLNL